MIVRFESSETGEILMFAETAKTLLDVLDKDTTARGTFTRDEMPQAAERLRDAVKRAAVPPSDDDEEENPKKKEPVVTLGQRAWPLIDMLERTGRSGKDAYIVWEAPADF
jgi:hypothetical protein